MSAGVPEENFKGKFKREAEMSLGRSIKCKGGSRCRLEGEFKGTRKGF